MFALGITCHARPARLTAHDACDRACRSPLQTSGTVPTPRAQAELDLCLPVPGPTFSPSRTRSPPGALADLPRTCPRSSRNSGPGGNSTQSSSASRGVKTGEGRSLDRPGGLLPSPLGSSNSDRCNEETIARQLGEAPARRRNGESAREVTCLAITHHDLDHLRGKLRVCYLVWVALAALEEVCLEEEGQAWAFVGEDEESVPPHRVLVQSRPPASALDPERKEGGGGGLTCLAMLLVFELAMMIRTSLCAVSSGWTGWEGRESASGGRLGPR